MNLYQTWNHTVPNQSQENIILKFGPNSLGQVLYFFGAQHTNDPNHPQFAALKELWGEFLNVAKKEKVALVEGATSALDSESEVAVQKALHALMEGKTVFAIAHRLSTLRGMDRILVFKDGKIVEDGTHRTLLKNKDGIYASFWSHQAGGFIKDDQIN